MHRYSNVILAVGSLAIILVTPANAGSNVKSAIQNAKQEVAAWTLVPKFDLGGRAMYEIYPDGTPLDVQQGKADTNLLWTPKDMKTETCLVGGTSYHKGDGPKWRKTRSMGGSVRTKVLWFYFKPKKTALEVMVQSCVTFKIHYGRPIVATDLEPDALARALGGFFEISGPNLTASSSVAERLAEVVGTAELETKPSTATTSSRSGQTNLRSDVATIAGVTVEASPDRVRHGESVELILRYDVLGPSDDPVEVSQSWTLLLDGQPLPTYPTERRIARSRGSHEAALQQVIPSNAPAGLYKLKGEVCVLEDCSTRTTTFEILP